MGGVAAEQRVGGRYALEREVGRGGLGPLWQAHDEVLDRAVSAEEVLPPPGLAPQERDRLLDQTLRAARVAGALHASSVVAVQDVVEEDGRRWVVTELPDARPLGQVLRGDGPLPPARAAQAGLEVLDALDAAHGAGLVHRDVKPATVLLRHDGRALLTGFGAAVLAGEPTAGAPGTVVGSPAYTAPERLRAAAPAPEMDLWSLGATLWTAVSGSSPFARPELPATLRAVTVEPLPPLPVPPGPLADALLGLLERDPQARLDAAGARDLLQRAAEAAELPADAGPALLPRHRARRRRLVPALVAGAVLLLAGGGLAVAAGWRPGGSPGTSAVPSAAPVAGTGSAPAAPAGQVPLGQGLYRDPSGWSVRVPQGWAVTPRGAQVELREPGGLRFLNITRDDHPDPDPAADWQRQEPFVAGRLPGYRLLSIAPVEQPGGAAADWDFTWQSPSGPLRVRDRALVVAPGRGFSLYVSGPESAWDADQALLDEVTGSLLPGL